MGATTTEVEIEVIEGEGDIMLGRAMDIKVKVLIIMEVIEKIITTKGVALKVVMQHIGISMTIGAKKEENIMETKIVIVGYKGRAGKENIDANEIANINNVFYSNLNKINWICDVYTFKRYCNNTTILYDLYYIDSGLKLGIKLCI